MAPPAKRDEADAAKRSFAVGGAAQSDHLTALRAYQMCDRQGQGRFNFAREHFLGIKTLQMVGSGRYCSPHHRMLLNQGSTCMPMMWRAIFICTYPHMKHALGPGKHCSTGKKMPFISPNRGSECVG